MRYGRICHTVWTARSVPAPSSLCYVTSCWGLSHSERYIQELVKKQPYLKEHHEVVTTPLLGPHIYNPVYWFLYRFQFNNGTIPILRTVFVKWNDGLIIKVLVYIGQCYTDLHRSLKDIKRKPAFKPYLNWAVSPCKIITFHTKQSSRLLIQEILALLEICHTV